MTTISEAEDCKVSDPITFTCGSYVLFEKCRLQTNRRDLKYFIMVSLII